MESKPNVLLVDRNPEELQHLEEVLSEKYVCFHAESDEDGIALLRENRSYCIVLLDYETTSSSQYSILAYIKSHKHLAGLAVLAMVNSEETEDIAKVFKVGVMDVAEKHSSPKIIFRRIENCLHVHRQHDMDFLTGGYSRNAFLREAAVFLRQVEDVTEYCLLYFNVKNFKAVNEMFGTEGGDIILKRIHEELRTSRLNPVMIARLEADHFVCIVAMRNIDLDAISARMVEDIPIKGKNMRLFARFGVYNIEDAKMPVTSMIDRAKLAKQNIVDESVKPYAVYNETMGKQYVDEAEVLSEFEDGIAKEQFQIYYQPIIEAATGNLASAEVLIRWNHPEKGLMSPGLFIPALEKNGFISRLDRFVLEKVRENVQQRVEQKLPVVPISVNLSWMDFYDESIMALIYDMVDHNEINQEKIRLEVTETSYAALEGNRKELLEGLREQGAMILLDDFGSGYSSFGMLENYSFDIIKIDMSFVQKIDINEKSKVIVRHIVDLCHELGIKTIAEGAENTKQVKYLKEIGCDYIQGYYYSKPMPGLNFAKYTEEYLKLQH